MAAQLTHMNPVFFTVSKSKGLASYQLDKSIDTKSMKAVTSLWETHVSKDGGKDSLIFNVQVDSEYKSK